MSINRPDQMSGAVSGHVLILSKGAMLRVRLATNSYSDKSLAVMDFICSLEQKGNFKIIWLVLMTLLRSLCVFLGLPMKLTYFVGPFDLLNHKTRSTTPLTIEGMGKQQIVKRLWGKVWVQHLGVLVCKQFFIRTPHSIQIKR